jgi:hypothetical protein
MPKPTPRARLSNILQVIMLSFVACLLIVCGSLIIALNRKEADANNQHSATVSLGPLEYRIIEDRAVKRNDSATRSLRSFLSTEAKNSGCPSAQPAHEQIVATTLDETQVFLKYGCTSADSPMYAIKKGDSWQTLSPTNHFNWLGLPDCAYVTVNNISNEIAPVCFNQSDDAYPTYSTR